MRAIIPVNGRIVNAGKSILVGVEDDHLIDEIMFFGLPEGGSQYTVGVVYESGKSKLIVIEPDGVLKITNEITNEGGLVSAQVIVQNGEKLWHTKPFKIIVTPGLQFNDDAEIDKVTVAKLAEMIEELEKTVHDHTEWTERQKQEIAQLANEKLTAIENVADTGMSAIYQTASEETEKIRTTVAPYAQRAQEAANTAEAAEESAAREAQEAANAAQTSERAAQTAVQAAEKAEGVEREISDFKVFLNTEKEDIASSQQASEQAKTDAVNASRDAQTAKSAAQTALQQLKNGIASGDFKGDKGDPGEPGTPGRDGHDGYTPIKGVDYFDGVDGKDGKDGSDAFVTSANIKSALGYTPANENDIPDVSDKLTEPTGMAVGKYFRVASIDDDGHAVLQAVDLPIKSVSAGGSALTPDANGNVNIPATNASTYGLVKAHPSANWKPQNNFGLYADSEGLLRTSPADAAMIDAKTDNSHLIPPNLFDYATRGSLISNSQITDADKPMICQTIGAEKDTPWETIIDETTETATKFDIQLPVDYKQIYILYTYPVLEKSAYFYLNLYNHDGTKSFMAYPSSAGGNVAGASRVYIDSYGGGTSVHYVRSMPLNGESMNFNTHSENDFDPTFGFVKRIATYNNLPAGTRFRICGRRA